MTLNKIYITLVIDLRDLHAQLRVQPLCGNLVCLKAGGWGVLCLNFVLLRIMAESEQKGCGM